MNLLTVVRRNPLVFALALAATAAMLFISEGSYWQAVGPLNDLGESAGARTRIEGLERSLLDAETGQRGYLLTDRREQLQPYAQALGEIDASLGLLDRYYGDAPEPLALLGRLRRLIDARLAGLAEAVRLQEAGERQASAQSALGDAGKAQLEAIRGLSAALLAVEAAKVDRGRSDIYRTLRLSRIGVAGLSVICLLALFMVLSQTSALQRQQQEQQRLIQAEHDRLEVEVAHRTQQLTELTQHLQTAREDERNRLARDLHDELGALLTSAKLDAARIRSRLGDGAPEALERLGHLVEMLNAGIALKRRIIENLRPSTLSHLGLVPTLEILAREYAEQSGVEVHCALTPVRLAPAAELMIYRLVQEAINNITKHARASHVWLSLGAHDGRVELVVRDDGMGFDTGLPRSAAYGLVGMRFRVEAEQGRLSLASAPGQGTRISVQLPEAAPAAA